MDRKLFSIVIPIYNNESNLSVTFTYILDHLSLFQEYDIEIIMVCDGSPDRSWEVMKEIKKHYPDLVHIIKLDKNYGQKMAVIAGISAAKGAVTGVISADLQDPFELFADMLKKWKDGYKVVAGCRNKRNDSCIRDLFGKIYHWFLHRYINSRYPIGGFDFFIIDKSFKELMINSVLKYGNSQFLILELANNICFIPYERKQREIGKSGYTFRQLSEYAVINVIINTDRLFYWMIYTGAAVCICSLIVAGFFALVMKRLSLTLVGIVISLLGICIMAIGLLGVSLFRWAQNFRNLPKYQVEEEW